MAREVKVAIVGDAQKFSRAARQAEDDASRLDRAFSKVSDNAGKWAKRAAVGFAGAAVAGGAMAVSFVRAAEESQQVTRQTDAVLQSMGATAWTTAGQVEALSKALSNKTGIDDEVIQSGQNVLLTFGQVQNRIGEGNDIFDRATRAALDMSTALGTDMSQASMQVGRALNDPLRGLTALRRSGIQFTAAQEDQIRAMVEAGDVAGAQRVMLEELERQFGGSAEAQATASQKLSTMWGNLQEDLGAKLLPTFEKVVEWLGANLPSMIAVASTWFGRLRDGIMVVVEWVKQNWPQIQATIQPVMERIREIITNVLGYLQGAWQTFGGTIVRFVTEAWSNISRIIQGAMEAIHGVINVVMGIIHGDWSQVWEGIRGIVNGVWSAIQGLVRQALNILRTVVSAGLEVIRGLFTNVWNGIVSFISGLPGRIAGAAAGMFDGIKNAFRSAINWIIDRWNGLDFSFEGFDIPGPGPNIPGFTLGLPHIPRLHDGGIFQAPGGAREGLALLESGERVISNRGGGEPVHVVVELDGRAIVDSLVRYNRSNGPIRVQVA